MDGSDIAPCVTSSRLQGPTGQEYDIRIAVPPWSAPDDGWPLLCLLDPSGCFDTAVEAWRRMARRNDATGVAGLVIMGIGSPAGLDPARRQRDFIGDGRQAMLDFLVGPARDHVADAAPIDRMDATLFGHSLAGLFALEALLAQPESFRAVAAVSPSIWHDPAGVVARGAALTVAGRDVLLLAGEWEGALPPWQAPGVDRQAMLERRTARDMTGRMAAMAAALAMAPGRPSVEQAILPDEDHASIVSAAIPRVLRLASRRRLRRRPN